MARLLRWRRGLLGAAGACAAGKGYLELVARPRAEAQFRSVEEAQLPLRYSPDKLREVWAGRRCLLWLRSFDILSQALRLLCRGRKLRRDRPSLTLASRWQR